MKNKNKKKIFRFISAFLIISILFVALSLPISALDIGNGATLTGLKSEIFLGPEGGYGSPIECSDIVESDGQISFLFDISDFRDYETVTISNYSFYSFSSSNVYGTLTLSIKGLSLFVGSSNYASVYDQSDGSSKYIGDMQRNFNNNSYTFSFTGYIPAEFYILSDFKSFPEEFFLTSLVTYDLNFSPRDPVADKLDQEAYPSFDDSQSAIDNSQVVEDGSLNNANGFINNTLDFVFDRSLFTEGGFVKGLRVVSTTFENFASIPFIGTILKYAVIFGLIGFVLGLATFVMRRRR